MRGVLPRFRNSLEYTPRSNGHRGPRNSHTRIRSELILVPMLQQHVGIASTGYITSFRCASGQLSIPRPKIPHSYKAIPKSRKPPEILPSIGIVNNIPHRTCRFLTNSPRDTHGNYQARGGWAPSTSCMGKSRVSETLYSRHPPLWPRTP